ncbi:MAG: RluA family pseudouridine synthase [Candidatus Dormibacter sp.]|uniref:RluA family pseudouridine synthase n=1 Tax=Candidatus Dormibacter sp. TaxID=2973982 RepID=UPI000DB5828B|nr:MAG: RluA family pseudouridine synthase [Candidatus Dormibacteraeota bacterium]
MTAGEAAAGRLDRALALLDPNLSRSTAARLARSGLVRLNGAAAKPADAVRPGDVLEYSRPERVTGQPAAESIPLRLIHDDPDFVVVDKPPGMVVHPAPGHSSGTLVNALLGLGGEWSFAGGEARPGIVHRLDKGTSGLILAARNDVAHRALAAQLAARTLSRTYLAIVRGVPAKTSGILEGPIGRDSTNRLRMAVVAGGRPARTRYQVLEKRPGHTLVCCDLETGRTHQIRVHLTALGHPLAGDDLYGGVRQGEPPRPLLHAWRLRLRHPLTDEPLSFEAPPPDDFTTFWEGL